MLLKKSNILYLIAFLCAVLLIFLPVFVLRINVVPPTKETFVIADFVRPLIFNIGLAAFIIASVFIRHKKSWKIGLGLVAIALTVILFGNVIYKAQDLYGFPLPEDFTVLPHIGVFLFLAIIIVLIWAMKSTADEIFPMDRDDRIKRYGNVT